MIDKFSDRLLEGLRVLSGIVLWSFLKGLLICVTKAFSPAETDSRAKKPPLMLLRKIIIHAINGFLNVMSLRKIYFALK